MIRSPKSLSKAALDDIARGGSLEQPDLLGALSVPAISERAGANAQIAQALLAAGRVKEAESFAERAWFLSSFAESFLPKYVEIQTSLGRLDRVRAAYRRAGMNLAAAGKTEEAIAMFSQSHFTYVRAGHGDRYEHDFEILNAVEWLASRHRPKRPLVVRRRARGPIRIAHLVFGANHSGSVLIKLLCSFAEHHDRSHFDVRFFVAESPNTARHKPQREQLHANVKLLEAHGARVECATAARELEAWLQTDRAIRHFGADVLVTTALLAYYSHFFIAAMRPALAVVGFGLGPPAQYAAPGMDWVVSATRHPMMDMPCDASVVEFEVTPPRREDIRPRPRSELEIPDDAPLVAVAGRGQKFLDRGFWTALSAILDENPGAYLLTLGLDDEPAFLGEVLAANTRARFRRQGWTADYLQLLANADIAIDTYPSGGGFALTDAMALGIPVTGFRNNYLLPFDQTDWSPLEEFQSVEELIVPRGDFASLRRVVGRLIDDAPLRRELGQRGRDSVLAHRSNPARMVRRHEEVYEAVVKRAARRDPDRSLVRPSGRPTPLARLRSWIFGRTL